MNLRRKVLAALMLVLVAGLGSTLLAQPIFEYHTPRGFSPSDSTVTDTAVVNTQVNVLVDLNEPANFTYPVMGNFQKLERSVPYFSTGSTAPYMSQALAVDADGVVHRAWIQQRGTARDAGTTPVYGVVYAKSFDGGKTFTDTVSVSGTLRFDLITPNAAYTSGFSTLDLVVNSKGNPRVVYAMDSSPDGIRREGATALDRKGGASGGVKFYQNVYFNYSNDGGSSWLPANGAVVVNDTVVVRDNAANQWPGRHNAFPRMAVTSTDDIFITYESNLVATPDIRLAKVDEDSLKLGSAQAVNIGSLGSTASRGGIRLDDATESDTGPDIAVGDDDVLHLVWYNYNNTRIEHKTMPAGLWTDVTDFGWDQITAGGNGANVGTFTPTAVGVLRDGGFGVATQDVAANAASRIHLFPTLAIDKAKNPDKIYVLWKSAGAWTADENINYNSYDYDGLRGPNAGWGTAASAFPTGSGLTADVLTGGPLFQNGTYFQVSSSWANVDRVAAAFDSRRGTTGDLHIVFSGGPTTVGQSTGIAGTGTANYLYYARYNGSEWELPQVVATAKNNDATGKPDGVPSKYQILFDPDLALRAGDESVFLTFVGGSPKTNGGVTPGRGYADKTGAGSIKPLPFFKKIGRVSTFEDVSVPKGAYEYVLSYTPINPQDIATAVQYNLVAVTAPDNQDGSGIGAATPGSSKAPGGFLTGQWRKVSATSLGVTSLTPASAAAIYKGAVSQNQAQNDQGVWEGKVDEDGSSGYGEWGDDGDKVGLLVKVNVLTGDSPSVAGPIFVIHASSAAKAWDGGKITQSIDLKQVTNLSTSEMVKGVTRETTALSTGAPLGSYFQIGARIDIVAANESPSVSIASPNLTTTANGAFSNETAAIQYTLYDADDDAGPATTSANDLKYEMYYYPDSGLNTVQDIRVFGTLIANENDNTNVYASGTNDFVEGTSATNTQTYTWDDPGATLQAKGFASITKALDGLYYIYIVADDGMNPPVWAMSTGPMRIRHIPMVKSVAPVSVDTVDTGEYTNLAKVNPYRIKFQLVDYNDNAQVRLFYSTLSSLSPANAVIAGTFPHKTMTLTGATPIQLSDTLRTDEDIQFDFDVTAQGATRDSIVAQGSYYIYAVVADPDSFAVGVSAVPLAVRHSPSFEFTAPLTGTIDKINTTQQFNYSVQWQRGRSDADLNGNAIISLYYTGVDPKTKNYSGTDSTSLIATTGTNAGSAVLIAGNIRTDSEGAGDQFIWSFRNPPGALPKTFRPKPAAGVSNSANKHVYQVGATTDTAWIYAVLHDSLGNSRVQAGGAVLLLGSQETPASQAPRVTMKTPPSGGMSMVNGDVVRLEWDAFLIDDGTGTDDAYLRIYAAPKNKYTTLTQLEANNINDGGDVYVVNSLDGKNTFVDYTGKTQAQIKRIRESDPNFYLWDTKTTSLKIQGTPTELDIFVAASMNPRFGENVYVQGLVDSVASGIGSQAQKAVLSKSPGSLRIEGADPPYSIELGPSQVSASTGDTLSFQVMVNSQGSSIDVMDLHLDVPRSYFEVVDRDPVTPGMQPFADSTGAFKTPSTIAQNDTTPGTAQFLKLNFVEAIINGEVVGNTAGDSSQVAATMKLVVKHFPNGAPLDTTLTWSTEPGRKTSFHKGRMEMAAPAREVTVKLTPRARLISTVPLEGRPASYSDTLDIHLRQIGNTHDIVDQRYIAANDVSLDTLTTSSGQVLTVGLLIEKGGTVTINGQTININNYTNITSLTDTTVLAQALLSDSVQVVSDGYGTFMVDEIPPGIYEMTVKAKGYVTGRTDTLNLFNGLVQTVDATFGSDLLGNLSPATALGFLRGGDANNDNQVDIADANRIFSLWNKTAADAGYVREADINADGVINAFDLGFVTTNFGNAGYGAAPVFKSSGNAGDNSAALVEVTGMESVEAWWPGRVFEVTVKTTGMSDVAAYGFTLSYDPAKVQPVESGAVTEGNVFAANPHGSLFFERVQSGLIDVTAGRIGREWSAKGDAELATVKFVGLTDDPGKIEVVGGQLVNSEYRGSALRLQQAEALPSVAALYPNFPNPFNPSTEIRFDVPTAREVQLKVYNQLGQTVRTLVDQRLKAGSYRMKWDGRNEAGQTVASGVYFYRLEAGDFTQIRKMTLVK